MSQQCFIFRRLVRVLFAAGSTAPSLPALEMRRGGGGERDRVCRRKLPLLLMLDWLSFWLPVDIMLLLLRCTQCEQANVDTVLLQASQNTRECRFVYL